MPTLTTQRLVLRKLTLSDAQDIYTYSSDERVARYVLWDAHRSISESRFFIRILQRSYRMMEETSYGIVLRDTGRVIGTIGFANINREHGCAEVGYSLAYDCWNRGYMTEALMARLRYGFETLHFHRIEAMHDVRNPASGRVMEKCAMREEGVLCDKLYAKGEHITVKLYAILYDEFIENFGKTGR